MTQSSQVQILSRYKGEEPLTTAVERDEFGAVAVLDPPESTTPHTSRPEGVGHGGPLAVVDLLLGVVATRVLPRVSAPRTDRASVRPGAGLRVPALLHAQPAADRRQDLLGDLGLFPPVGLPVHGMPGREARRKRSPGAPGADHVEDRVDDRAAWVLPRRAVVFISGSSGSISAHCSSPVSEG